MKLILTFFITPFFFSTLSFGQIKVSEADFKEVMMFSQQGQTDKANDKINALRKTVTVKDSLYANLIAESAEMNIDAFNCEQAITDLAEIIQLNPKGEINCQTQLARVKKYLGDFEGAIVAYKRIFQLDPKDDITFNNMASAYISEGKYQDAIRVLDSNPNAERLPHEYSLYSVAYFNLNKLDSAELNIDKYLIVDNAKTDFLSYKVAAQIYSALGNKKKSCEYITKANDIIAAIKPEEQISKMPAKVKDYFFMKEMLKQINETKELKLQLCK